MFVDVVMLPVVHIHLGAELPTYFNETVRQTRRFHSGPLVCVGPAAGHINTSRWDEAKQMRRLREVSWLDRRYCSGLDPRYYPNGLWGHALERLFVLAELMREQGWDSALQIENDVAIYFDPADAAEVMRQCFGQSCAAVPASPTEGCTAALFYVGSLAALDAICAEILQLLLLSKRDVCAQLSSGMVNEMVLLGIVQRQHPDLLSSFPIAPSEPRLWPLMPRYWWWRLAQLARICDRIAPRYSRQLPPHGLSNHLEAFGALFDPSSFGQFAGGTPQGHPPGSAFPHHWLGRDLASGRFALVWEKDAQGRRIPFVSDRADGRRWRLNNLHIHSKRIGDFV
jgi:hypothetical protein